MSFIFGGNTGMSYDEIQRKRQIADQLLSGGFGAKNVGEGLAEIGKALTIRGINKRTDKADAANRDDFNSKWANIAGMLSGGGAPAGVSSAPSGVSSAPIPVDPKSPQGIANDTMVALGKAPDYTSLESQYGLPEGYLARTAQLESGGNPNAQNPNSSAGGTFQFIDSTAKQYGLTDKFDPVASADAAARLARDNAQALRAALGREPTAAELYLAHQQGAGGAIKLLQGGNNPAGAAVTRDALRFNGGDEGMTAADFANKWVDKFNAVPGAVSAQPANMDLAQLAEIAGNPYASPGQKAIVQQLMQQQLQAQDPAYQMGLEKSRLELEALRNPTQMTPYQQAQIDISRQRLEMDVKKAGDGVDVQAAKILEDGTTIMPMKSGDVLVRGPDGSKLEGQAAADAIARANAQRVENERSVYYGRREGQNAAEADTGAAAAGAGEAGKQAIELSGEAYKSYGRIAQSNNNISDAIAAIDAGGKAGAVDKFIPNITEASAELKNAMDRMGLDVIGAVTFGALSEGELKLAMETAVPRNLDETELRSWLVKKQEANQKASQMLMDVAIFLGTPGNTLAKWIEKNKAAGTSPTSTPAAPTATHRFNPDTGEIEAIQ